MTKKIAILAGVALVLVAILWLKPRTPVSSTTENRPSSKRLRATVLLFANPREAESRCGCAEIIRLARSASKVPGVVVQEFDPRQRADKMRRYRVRVSPTVIITGPKGHEQGRFEGESAKVIAMLRTAIRSLSSSTPPNLSDR